MNRTIDRGPSAGDDRRSNAGQYLVARRATLDDVPLLATQNRRLIEDEGSRNPMTVAELVNRMEGWLRADYAACVFELAGEPVAYALWRDEDHRIYLRQFFVARDHRRTGIGRAAFRLLVETMLPPAKPVAVDVLAGNEAGQRFWEALGFRPYAVTLERPPRDG